MKPLRTLTGIVLILAAIAGLAVTVIAILEIRDAAPVLSGQSANILDSTQDAVIFLKRGTTKLHNLVIETKTHTQALDTTLASIEKKMADAPGDKTLLDTLDEPLARQLRRAQVSLGNLHSTLQSFHNTLVIFNSLPSLSKPEATPAKGADETEALSKTLVNASDTLEHIVHFLNEVVTDREVTKKSLSEVSDRVRQIRNTLTDAESQVDSFRQRLAVTEDRIRSTQQSLPLGIERASLYLMIFLTCFGFTQLGLFLQGCSMLRGCKTSDRSPS